MILIDDKGVEHDGFKRLFDMPWKRMSLWVSGGSDSAFGYWYMAKMLAEHNLDKTIVPVYINVLPDTYGLQAFNYVDEFIRSEFPEAPIDETLMFEHQPSPTLSKNERMDQIRQALYSDHNIDKDIGFVTAVADDFNPPLSEQRMGDVLKRRNLKETYANHSPRAPLHTMDKKGLAEQYKTFELMDTLYPYTKSCTSMERLPCGKCFWCHEKGWAFGTMDKGIPFVDKSQPE